VCIDAPLQIGQMQQLLEREHGVQGQLHMHLLANIIALETV
jgi:hypothetical protein